MSYKLGESIYDCSIGNHPNKYEVVKVREIEFKTHVCTYIYGINLDNGHGLRFYIGSIEEKLITKDRKHAWKLIWLRQSNLAKQSKDFYFNTILKD